MSAALSPQEAFDHRADTQYERDQAEQEAIVGAAEQFILNADQEFLRLCSIRLGDTLQIDAELMQALIDRPGALETAVNEVTFEVAKEMLDGYADANY